MTATAANMAELEAALENLLDTIAGAEKAIMATDGLPIISQVYVVTGEMAKISRADTRYRRARASV